MTGMSLIRTLVRGGRRQTKAQAVLDGTRSERRRPVYRCNGCVAWGSELVHMSNGGDYCLPCARTVSGWFGTVPAGRRKDDIRTLDEAGTSRAARQEIEQRSSPV
jgi:hypothetical protein